MSPLTSCCFEENRAPRKPNSAFPLRNVWSKPKDNPKVNGGRGLNNSSNNKNDWDANGNKNNGWEVNDNDNDWGLDGNEWTRSERGEPVGSAGGPNPDRDMGGNNGGDEDHPWNPPAAQDWSQSELGGGSQVGAKNGPNRTNGAKSTGFVRGKTKGGGGAKDWTRSGPKDGFNTTPAEGDGGAKDWTRSELGDGLNTAPADGTGGAKDWTRSELGIGDSVSQRGDDGFRNAPTRNPNKKSWADLVEDGDEMDYNEPASLVVAPELSESEDGNEQWMNRKGRGSGRGSKGRGRGKGRGRK